MKTSLFLRIIRQKESEPFLSDKAAISWRLLPLLYFLAATFSHDWVSQIYLAIFEQFGRTRMEWALDWGSTTILSLVVIAVLLWMKSIRTFHWKDLVVWAVALTCLYGMDRFLVCTNVERIHFPQYAVLAFLLKYSMDDDFLILYLSTMGGVFDELVQFVMHPKYTGYLDYNDFVLNLIGAVLGLLIYRSIHAEFSPSSSSHTGRVKRVVYFSSGCVFLLVLAGYLCERIIPYLPMPDDPKVFMRVDGKLHMVLSFLQQSQFWTVTEYGRKYHILSPFEGMVLVVLLLALFGAMLSWSTRKKIRNSKSEIRKNPHGQNSKSKNQRLFSYSNKQNGMFPNSE